MQNAQWERYLDHATTSWPKAPGVSERMAEVLEKAGASPGRALHAHARGAADLVEQSRAAVARYFGGASPAHVVFTSGATAALNFALKGLLRPNDHVVATSFDHNSTLRPLARLRRDGVRVTIVHRAWPDEDFVDLIIREIRPNTRLVVINHASNVLGCILPYDVIATAAHARGALALLDTAQTAGFVPIDLSRSPVDMLVFSGHKGMLGPPGVGGLIVHNQDALPAPLIDGGTGYRSEELDPAVVCPTSFEAGTPNTPGIAAMGVALDFLTGAGRACHGSAIAARRRCATRLCALPNVTVIDAPRSEFVPIVSFAIRGVSPARVAAQLDAQFGLQVRAGLHCAPLTHEAMGTKADGGTVRASFGYGSTPRSVDLLCEAVESVSRGL